MHTHNTERTTQRDENWGKSFKALSLNFRFAAAPPYRHFFIHPPDPHFPQFFCCLPSGYLGRLFGFGYAEYSRSVDHLVLNCEPNRAGKQKKAISILWSFLDTFSTMNFVIPWFMVLKLLFILSAILKLLIQNRNINRTKIYTASKTLVWLGLIEVFR